MEYIEEYVLKKGLNDEFIKLYNFIYSNLNFPFDITNDYGMINFSVPFSIYGKGYHVNPKIRLPFISIAIQKNYISFYHSGIYMFKDVYNEFINSYIKKYNKKPDIGKVCIRFKGEIPYDLIKKIIEDIDVYKYIEEYEKVIK